MSKAGARSITPEDVRALVSYDPLTGAMTYKTRQPGKYGDARAIKIFNTLYAGKSLTKIKYANGVFYSTVWGVRMPSLRVAWMLDQGTVPDEVVPRDGDQSNTAASNLQNVSTRHRNRRNNTIPSNNTSGYRGVHWCNTYNLWIAQIDGKFLGRFAKKESAVAARRAAEIKYGYKVADT